MFWKKSDSQRKDLVIKNLKATVVPDTGGVLNKDASYRVLCSLDAAMLAVRASLNPALIANPQEGDHLVLRCKKELVEIGESQSADDPNAKPGTFRYDLLADEVFARLKAEIVAYMDSQAKSKKI